MRYRQLTPPTRREDGSPLTGRDRWQKTNPGLWYCWEPVKSLWLSEQLFCGEIGRFGSMNASTTYPMGSVLPDHDVWLEHFIYSGVIDSPTSSMNYWQVQLRRRESTDVLEYSQDLKATQTNEKFYYSTNFQAFRSMSKSTAYIAVINKFGLAANLSHFYLALYYRLIPRV